MPIVNRADTAHAGALASPPESEQRVALRPERLGPGLHAAFIELRSQNSGAQDSYWVRTPDEQRFKAVLAYGIDPGLVAECFAAGRLVIVSDTPKGVAILGALQTTRSLTHEPDGTVSLQAKKIRLSADEGVVIAAGQTSLRMNKEGAMRTEGHRMVIDMSSNLRVLSALVELP